MSIDLNSWHSPGTVVLMVGILYAFLPTFVSQMRKALYGQAVQTPDQNISVITALLQAHESAINDLNQKMLPPDVTAQVLDSVRTTRQLHAVLAPLAAQVQAKQRASPPTSAATEMARFVYNSNKPETAKG